MVSLGHDQAAGLRRLFPADPAAAGIVFAGAAGRGPLIAGIARGLAAAGKQVLVIDEQDGAAGAAAAFGLRSRFDLLQAVNRDVPLDKVLLHADDTIRLLPAARASRQLARLDAMTRQALDGQLRHLQQGADYVLTDAALRAGSAATRLLAQPQRTIVATATDGASLTETYGQMKRLAQSCDCRRFGCVILHAANPAAGEAVFANLREVTRRHLGRELELLGCQTGRSPAKTIGEGLVAALLLDAPRPRGDGSIRLSGRPARHAAAPCPVV